MSNSRAKVNPDDVFLSIRLKLGLNIPLAVRNYLWRRFGARARDRTREALVTLLTREYEQLVDAGLAPGPDVGAAPVNAGGDVGEILGRPPGCSLDERDKVISLLAASHAVRDGQVIRFRKRALDKKVIAWSAVEQWLHENTAAIDTRRDAPLFEPDAPGPDGKIVYLDPVSLHIKVHPARRGTIGGWLADLAARLANVYSWEREAATVFLLTGLVPPVRSVRLRRVGGWPLPFASRIILDVDPHVTPLEIERTYRNFRKQHFNHRLRRLSSKHTRLALMVAQTYVPYDWEELMQRWNEQCPTKERYKKLALFKRDAETAIHRLVYPNITTSRSPNAKAKRPR